MTALSLLLACAGDGGQAPTGGAYDNIGSTPPARAGAPVSTNPPGVMVSPSSTGGGGTRPPDGGARADAGATTDAPVAAAACMMTVTAAGNNGLIDNFTDNNANILPNDMRMGRWEISKSATTTLAGPAVAPAPELPATGGLMNGRNLRLRGTEADPASYGAGATVYFVDPTNGCYDASAYAGGLRFSIKGLAGTVVGIAALTGDVRATGAAPATIGWYRFVLPPFDAAQAAAMRTVTVAWTDFKPSYGVPPAPNADPRYLIGFQFFTMPRPPGAAGGAVAGVGDFDFSIDQVELIH